MSCLPLPAVPVCDLNRLRDQESVAGQPSVLQGPRSASLPAGPLPSNVPGVACSAALPHSCASGINSRLLCGQRHRRPLAAASFPIFCLQRLRSKGNVKVFMKNPLRVRWGHSWQTAFPCEHPGKPDDIQKSPVLQAPESCLRKAKGRGDGTGQETLCRGLSSWGPKDAGWGPAARRLSWTWEEPLH